MVARSSMTVAEALASRLTLPTPRRQAGDRNLPTMQRYMHINPSAIVDAIRLLDGAGDQSFEAMVETAGWVK